MLSFILRRLLVAIPTILILVVISFMLMFAAPGGPFNSEKALPEAVLRNIEARYGLDQPYAVQIFNYVKNIVLHFDFGPSFKLVEPQQIGVSPKTRFRHRTSPRTATSSRRAPDAATRLDRYGIGARGSQEAQDLLHEIGRGHVGWGTPGLHRPAQQEQRIAP